MTLLLSKIFESYLFQPSSQCSRLPVIIIHLALCCGLQSLSYTWLFATPRPGACQPPLSSPVSQSLFKFMSIESLMLSNQLILHHPLLLPLIFPSIRVFSNELALCIKWPKHWSLEDRNSDRTQKHCRVSAYFWDTSPTYWCLVCLCHTCNHPW